MGNSRTVDLLEHLPHAVDVVVVEEPRLAVLLILFKGDTEGVRDVDRGAVVLTQEDTDDAFAGASRYRPRVMICY